MTTPTHRLGRGLLALTLLAATAGCSGAVAGSGHQGTPSVQSTSATVPSSAATSSSAPAPNAPLPKAAQVVALLASPPQPSHPWGTAWSANVTPTITELLQRLYTNQDQIEVTAAFQREGLNGIAHRTWIVPSNKQADDLLLGFDSAAGADDRYQIETSGWAGHAATTTFTIPGLPSGAQAAGYYQPKPDSDGNVRAELFAIVGKTVMMMFFFAPHTMDTATANTWADAQLSRLPS